MAGSTEPIRNTTAYKALSETIVDALDDSGSANHAGYEGKDADGIKSRVRLVYCVAPWAH
jgi:import inner membrane translocase subunit TIM44